MSTTKVSKGIKLVALVWRKPGLTHEEFKEHYENVHLRLVEQYTPQHFEHRRNYVRREGYGSVAHGPTHAPDFDVMSEVFYESQEAFDELQAANARPDIAEIIGGDEATFVDREKTIFFLAEEIVTTDIGRD